MIKVPNTILIAALTIGGIILVNGNPARAQSCGEFAEAAETAAPGGSDWCCKIGVKVKCGAGANGTPPADTTATDLGEGNEKCLKQKKDAQKNREDDAMNRAQTHCNGRPVASLELTHNCTERTRTSVSPEPESEKTVSW